ncbi:MAG: SGNH/GDSL hydrolase family protein [Puniceicoccales bacterium]
MRNSIRVFLLATTGAASLSAGNIDFTSVDRMVIFGDSLSDSGNTGIVNEFYTNNSSFLTNAAYPAVPGYTQFPDGAFNDFNQDYRFTNGDMWWEFLANDIQSNVNSNFNTHIRRALPYNPFGDAGDGFYTLQSDVLEASNNSPHDWRGEVDASHGQNWAWGGARVAVDAKVTDSGFEGHFQAPDTYLLPSVKSQITNFQNAGQSIDDSDVVFLWSGANDYFLYNAATSPIGKLASFFKNFDGDTNNLPADLGTTTAQAQLDNVNRLISPVESGGLGVTNLMVMNLPDLSKTPAAINGEFNNFSLQPGDFTEQFNTTLEAGIAAINALGVNISFIDIEEALNNIIEDPAGYGFDVSLLYGGDGEYDPQSVFHNLEGEYNTIAGIDDYHNGFASWLFWDHVHPTQAAHRALSNYIFANAVVPEPRDYALIAGVLGLAAVVASRRRKLKRG